LSSPVDGHAVPAIVIVVALIVTGLGVFELVVFAIVLGRDAVEKVEKVVVTALVLGNVECPLALDLTGFELCVVAVLAIAELGAELGDDGIDAAASNREARCDE